MEVRFVPPDLRRIDELKSEALVVPHFSDERPLRGALGLVDWRLCGRVSRLILRGRMSGELGETTLVPARPRLPVDKIFIIGAGPAAGLDDSVFAAVVKRMLDALDRARVRASVISLPRASITPERAMTIFLECAGASSAQDVVTFIELPDAQRAMMPVVERERRREQAEEWD